MVIGTTTSYQRFVHLASIRWMFSQDEEPIESLLDLLGPTDDPEMLGRIAGYEVVGVIGRGGMGVVFKAFDRSLNRYVAIKMLLPHLATTGAARKRFEREGQAAAAVIDDYVLPIYAVSQWQGVPYLVTQYLRGNTLQKLIHDSGPLELRDILRIGMQTARGLAAAHAQGLVHRDVKPSNILLDGAVSRAMLTDFGLARAVDDASITRTGIVAGTPQYMSPEQARGGSVDSRSDLFGLGCVLYTMCTGRPPFRAENSYAVLRMITDQHPRPIREINPDIPAWLCSIIDKLMSKRPEDRYASADELAELLEDCLAHVSQPLTNSLPRIVSVSSWIKTWVPIMNDKRLFSLISLYLFIASVLFLWPIAAFDPNAFVLMLCGSALLLAIFFGVLSRTEYLSRIVLRTLGGILGLLVIGYVLGPPFRFWSARREVQENTRIDQVEVQRLQEVLKPEAVEIDGAELDIDPSMKVDTISKDLVEVSGRSKPGWEFVLQIAKQGEQAHESPFEWTSPIDGEFDAELRSTDQVPIGDGKFVSGLILQCRMSKGVTGITNIAITEEGDIPFGMVRFLEKSDSSSSVITRSKRRQSSGLGRAQDRRCRNRFG